MLLRAWPLASSWRPTAACSKSALVPDFHCTYRRNGLTQRTTHAFSTCTWDSLLHGSSSSSWNPSGRATHAGVRTHSSSNVSSSSSEEEHSADSLKQELERLTSLYQEHSKLYYSGQQALSDDAFDAIKHKLSSVEEAVEEAMGRPLPFRATKQIGAPIEALEAASGDSSATATGAGSARGALQTVQHALPMLSLAARNSKQEVKHWHDVSFANNMQRLAGRSPKGLAWVLEPKIDGLAVSATYQDGCLVRLATRGDGLTGQDVTRHAPNIKGLPMQLLPPTLPLSHPLSRAKVASNGGSSSSSSSGSREAPSSSAGTSSSKGGAQAGRGDAAGDGKVQRGGRQQQGQGVSFVVPALLEVRGEVYMTKADFQACVAGSSSSASSSAEHASTAQHSSSRQAGTRKTTGSRSKGSNGVPAVVASDAGASGSAQAAGEVGSNPRNTAAGTLRSQSPTQSAVTSLSFMAYQLLQPPASGSGTGVSANYEGSGSGGTASQQHTAAHSSTQQQPLYVLRSQYDSLRWLRAAGFDTSKDARRCNTFTEALDAAEAWMEQRDQLEYEVDGSVLKLDDQELVALLGARHADPLWAIAWKFPPLETTTRVTDICLTLGKQGKITPIATLEPVNIGGVVVKHASLGNVLLVQEMGLHIGDLVVLVRANDVIPKINGVVPGQQRQPGSQPWQPPRHCPSCNGPVVIENRDLMCHNPQCQGRSTKQIEVFARVCLEGSRLAGKSVKALMDAGLVKDIPDLYSLTEDDLLQLPSWGPKKVEPIIQTIEHSRNHLSLRQLLQGLAVSSVGSETAVLLAKHYHNLRQLQRDAESGHVAGMSGKNMEKLMAWFASPDNKALIDRLAQAGIACVEGVGPDTAAASPSDQDPSSSAPAAAAAATSERLQPSADSSTSTLPPPVAGPLSGERVVITGACKMGPRHEVSKILEQYGAEIQSSASSSTTMMVVGEVPAKQGKPTFSPKKVEAAQRKGVRVITEKDLMRQLGLL